ncbi:MAG: virulence factor SrfB [Rhodospirillales bacterium]|nr:virulence factor SrfB [Rhodospirillales bacterium]
MPLNDLTAFPAIVSVIPKSGVQFLDFGFSIAKSSPVPKDWGFYDDPKAAARPTGAGDEAAPIVVRRGDVDSGLVETYAIDHKRIFEAFDRVWMPFPLFREELGGGYFRGPTNWARAYLVRLDAPDDDGNDIRLILALDTDLIDFVEDEAYLAPSPHDTTNGRSFSLPSPQDPTDWFLREPWVKEWCLDVFKEMIEAEDRRRSGSRHARPLTLDELRERMEGPHEYLARYQAFIELIFGLDILPKFVLVDRITEPRPAPIDVDIVIDLGNSRTCGLLIEAQPDQLGADITQAVKLQLRDLSRPELVYSDPFDSRIEFSRATFGRDHLSLRSGRAEAFSWPTIVRVGPEAVRLASLRRGSEGSTGLSGPKRYLWDDDPRRDSWRFNSPMAHGEQSGLATGVAFTTLVNDIGDAIHQIPQATPAHDEAWFPSIRALYSRRNMMAFTLAEIFYQAIGMMNAPAHRLRRRNADLPRRLRRIIMTIPTAMPLAERQIMQRQAEIARDLVYLCIGAAAAQPAADGASAATLLTHADTPLPDVVLKWDEASATQAVFLYSQIALHYSGDARAFFNVLRHPLNRADGASDAFRLATLDVGGGTTDLVVTSFRVEGQGANVTLFPRQEFREGFNLAGDDAVFRVVREHVVEPIRRALGAAGLGDRTDYLLNRLFGGDRGDMTVIEQLRRQQFAAQIAAPIAIGMLAAYESYDPLAPMPATSRPFAAFFDGTALANETVVTYVNQEADKLGATGFELQKMVFPIDFAEIDRTVRSVFLEMLQSLGEVVWRCQTDVLLLSGRPSRLPAVCDILRETCALPPHRIIPLHTFRVGQWYPFRDYQALISDPKTTASVGAMLCLLGEGQLQNFNFRADELKPQSTARFFGKLSGNNRLLKDDEYYEGLDLDDREYELPEKEFDFRGPMPLGFRQFPVDWWPGTRLYSLDYASPELAPKLNARTPLKIRLKRNTREVKDIIDSFVLSRIEDRDGRSLPNNNLRLRLQTIDNQRGYWLDTGILLDK